MLNENNKPIVEDEEANIAFDKAKERYYEAQHPTPEFKVIPTRIDLTGATTIRYSSTVFVLGFYFDGGGYPYCVLEVPCQDDGYETVLEYLAIFASSLQSERIPASLKNTHFFAGYCYLSETAFYCRRTVFKRKGITPNANPA